MITDWWWVRHGPTHEKVFTGWRDVPADLSNINQISRLKTFLPQNAIYVSSDLKRATATAKAISSGNQEIIIDPSLREFNFGLWDGLGFDEVARGYPTKSKDFWEKPGTISAPAGESWNMVQHRVSEVVKKYTKAYKGSNIIAVAHLGTILTQVQFAIKKTPYEVLAQKIENLSVTHIQVDEKGSFLKELNFVP